jgi:hypothetical protein
VVLALTSSCSDHKGFNKLDLFNPIIDNRNELNRKKLKFNIINNPYGLDKSYKFYVFFNDTLIATDDFNQYGRYNYQYEAFVPTCYFNRGFMPKVVFRDKLREEYYYSESDISFYLDSTDRYIYLVFSPELLENERYLGSLLFFSTRESIF